MCDVCNVVRLEEQEELQIKNPYWWMLLDVNEDAEKRSWKGGEV